MKVLIVYSTKNGVSRRACEMLAKRLEGNATIEMYDVKDNPPSPAEYDVAVVGGSIRMTKLSKKLKAYIKSNSEILSNMHSAAFICCGLTNDFEDYVVTELPKQIKFSLGIHCFGGELKTDRVHGMDKIFTYFMRQSILTQDPDKSNRDMIELPEIFPDTINALAERIHYLKKI
jgi:menaquinone-dependent protoporphyrinogen oxidase